MPAIKTTVEIYLEEGLLAVVPVYDNGDRSAVITLKGRHQEGRTVLSLVKSMAAAYSLDLTALRSRSAELLRVKHHISLALNENLVLLPVKVRTAAEPGEMTIGYVNLGQVESVLEPPEGEGQALSRVVFKSGFELPTINTADKIKKRMEHGKTVLTDLILRRSRGISYTGLTRQSLLELMPTCECLLKDLFIGVLDLSKIKT